MTGQGIIDFIKANNLQDYLFIASNDGGFCSDEIVFEVDNISKEVNIQ